MFHAKWQHEEGHRDKKNGVIVSGNYKQFAGSDPHNYP